ncbi:MAG: hypothetical protein M3R15_25230 [Acidobacteriota bacterium]|nr:hypothetical protein [Acidobacteriota bacterium]
MKISSNKFCFTAVATAFVIVGVWIAGAASQQSTPTVSWEQTQSVSIKLGIKGREWESQSFNATFIINGPTGVESSSEQRLEKDQFKFLYFPEDFGLRALPGKYKWRCVVGEKVIAGGEFEYVNASGQGEQARIIK